MPNCSETLCVANRETLVILDGMLDEVQERANVVAVPAADKLLCLAKRNALSELKLRLRGNEPDKDWATRRPKLSTIVWGSPVRCVVWTD